MSLRLYRAFNAYLQRSNIFYSFLLFSHRDHQELQQLQLLGSVDCFHYFIQK